MITSTLADRLLSLYGKHPRVAIFMSGSGTNARALLSDSNVRRLYDVAAIFTDKPGSNAQKLAHEFGVEYKCIEASFRDSKGRQAYFDKVREWLDESAIQAIFYAGFMKVVTAQITQNYPGVNVHPSDLSIKGVDGQASYRGMDALADMAAHEDYIACTFHVVDDGVDTGQAISVSRPLPLRVAGTKDTRELHNLLKQLEHELYPSALTKLAEGTVNVRDLPLKEA